jgi:hypothetical protein
MEIIEKIPIINDHLTIREIGGDIVILSEKDLEIHNLEGTAAFLWKCIDGESTVGEIIRKLFDAYEVTMEQAKADIVKFIEECEKKRLVSFRNQDKG